MGTSIITLWSTLIVPFTVFPTTAAIYSISLVIIILVRNAWLGRAFGIELLRFLCLHRSTYSRA